jgi:sodium/potassium-transporting ATPase subunit alpha
MKSIKNIVAEETTVVRDGQKQTIPAPDVVVGDVVVLSVGDRVPADLRIMQASSDLKFDRSLLTGERYALQAFISTQSCILKTFSLSEMVPGVVGPTSQNALETRNLALSSTFVAQGTCTGVVFAIGDKSVMGRIVAMSGEFKFKMTTVQKEVWFFTKIISCIALASFCISLLVWGVWIRTSYPGYATASAAIINCIGCLTACVPQVSGLSQVYIGTE